MKGYKITSRHRGHLCYECSRFINLGCPAVIDLDLYGHIKGQKAYFHPQCYKDTQLTLNPAELEEFENALSEVS